MHALAALLFSTMSVAAFAQPAEPAAVAPWQVVLLRDWDSLYSTDVAREMAMRDAISRDPPRPIQMYPEPIDLERLAEFEGETIGRLKRRYEGEHIDVVLASGIEALQFATRYRDAVWPGAAIVFAGVVDGALDQWTRPPRTCGVTTVRDVLGVIALARNLMPQAHVIYFVAGAAPPDRYYLDIALRELHRLQAPLEARFIVGLGIDETLERLRKVERDSIVLYLTMQRDGSGKVSSPNVSPVTAISSAANAPVFSALYSHSQLGPVGVSSSPSDVHGRAAAKLVRRVLAGENPDLIQVRAEPLAECEVDGRALQRFGLAEQNVPARCKVLNRVVPLAQAYFWPLAAMVAIVLLQSVLLWALAWQSVRRRRLEAQLQARSSEMAQVARLSTAGALTASIAHEINQPLGAILGNADAAQMMLAQGPPDAAKLREILEDIRSEDLRASEVIRTLRRFLANKEINNVTLEVNREVADALHHVAYEASRRGVHIIPVFGADTPPVLGDSVQVQQVVVNLAMNAIEAVAALPENRREVFIETRARDGGAQIMFTDRGAGIEPETAKQIFRTMFTTKGNGMGFGLFIVRTIVEMHHGRVAYEPNLPRGARFIVWLPAIGQ